MRKILVDADTGVDDALALIMAFNSPEIEILGVTTVAGNSTVDNCTRNTLVVADGFARSEFEVARGAEKGLKRAPFTAEEVHGPCGMGTIAARQDVSEDRLSRFGASEFILRALSKNEDVEILATGPLTNLARAFTADEKTFRRIKRVVSMGGAFDVPGNTGPFAEFNYFVDPEAADLIVASGLDVTVVPLDVTTKALLERNRLGIDSAQEHHSADDYAYAAVIDACNFYFDYHKKVEGIDGGFMHDPVALAVMIDDSIAQTRESPVTVELDSRRRGMTSGALEVDRPAVKIATEIDLERFWKLFGDRVLDVLRHKG